MFEPFLKPLNWLYGEITDVRNLLYDSHIMETLRPATYTIGVGNLTVGGTGKTPHVDYLVRLLKDQGPMATLSRGYGRRTRGFRIATASDTADTIGDEPLLLYRKHAIRSGPRQAGVLVSVGEKRAEAIPKLLVAEPDLQTIILDDAFQHRPVQPHLNLLLTDFHRLFYHDEPFPGGRLRERRHGARRADAVLVTKCPDDLGEAEQQVIEQRIRVYSKPDAPVFFTGLQYGKPLPFGEEQPLAGLGGIGKPVVLVSGIARPEPLEQYARAHYTLVEHLRFADHYRYTSTDLARLRRVVPPDGVVLTTEKDFVKLAPLLAETGRTEAAFYYLPIEIRFLNRETEFLAMVRAGLAALRESKSIVKKS
ncbi:tetraacyldisaccharide 4'-kinase [Larkinella sp. VNQ87]|uniref:tetraacyldisaccharide 4'-kinase n=1 Tax=Larkinella sp. VNQ87 TaxID=3400921 RepID=UPI003C093039